MSARWDAGWQPYARAQRPDRRVQCYFCGEATAIISDGDNPEDTGRVEVYCLNSQCDAREVTALVTRDGHGCGWRADVQALDEIDKTPEMRQADRDRAARGQRFVSLAEIVHDLDDPERYVKQVARRTARAPLHEALGYEEPSP